MTRRLRTDDLPALTIAGQPAIAPDASRIAYVVRGNDLDADKPVESIWLTDAAGSARRLTQGTTDTSPAFSPDGETLAFQRDGQLWTLPLGGGDATKRTSLPDLGRRTAVEPRLHPHRLHRARRRRRRRRRGRHRPPAPRRRPDRRRPPRLPDRRHGLRPRRADAAARARPRVRRCPPADGCRRPRPRRRLEPRLREARLHRDAAASRTSTRARPVHVIDAADVKARPEVVAFADGFAGTVAVRTRRRDARRRGLGGRAERPRRPLRGRPRRSDPPRQLAASLNRNVMPGAPAYPGALPQFTVDRRRAVRHPRPRLHPPLLRVARRRRAAARARRRGTRRERPLGRRIVRRDRPRDSDVVRRDRPPRPRIRRARRR